MGKVNRGYFKTQFSYFICLFALILSSPCLAFGQQCSYSENVGASSAYVIVVDGLCKYNLVLDGLQGDDNYLYHNLISEPVLLEKQGSITLIAYQWNCSANTTPLIIKELRDKLKEHYKYAKDHGIDNFIIVSHSWGTVLTYLALALESQGADPIIPDLYITLSSPLGTENIHVFDINPLTAFKTIAAKDAILAYTDLWVNYTLRLNNCPNCKPSVKRAINYWAIGDFISAPLKGKLPLVDDRKVDKSLTNTRSYSDLTNTLKWHKYTALDPKAVPPSTPTLNLACDVRKEILFTIKSSTKPNSIENASAKKCTREISVKAGTVKVATNANGDEHVTLNSKSFHDLHGGKMHDNYCISHVLNASGGDILDIRVQNRRDVGWEGDGEYLDLIVAIKSSGEYAVIDKIENKTRAVGIPNSKEDISEVFWSYGDADGDWKGTLLFSNNKLYKDGNMIFDLSGR